MEEKDVTQADDLAVDHTVTPYFTVPDPEGFMDFLVTVFGGRVVVRKPGNDGAVLHARVRLGNTIIMLNEASAEFAANVSQMHIWVDDVDRSFETALAAGGTAIMKPNIRPHGDRMAGVADPCGNMWWIASPVA